MAVPEPCCFVQVVSTFWTKASRGAPQAAARAQRPDAFALADIHLEQLLTGECYAQAESPSVGMFLVEPAKLVSDLDELR